MEKTTSRKLARQRLMEAQQAAAAVRAAQERANLADLTEFTVRMAQVDEVDDWFARRLDKLKDEAEQKRLGHRRAAGRAVHTMRLRGETMASISKSTGLSVSRLRELMKFASEQPSVDDRRAGGPDAEVVPLPNRAPSEVSDDILPGAVMGAQ